MPGQGVQIHEVRGSPSSIWQDHAGGRATRGTEAGRKERKTPNVNTTTTQVFHIEKDGFDVICDATGNILTDMELLKKIRQWRYEKAKEKNMRAYWIINNATLVDLATRMPITREELLSISGIGEKKVEIYGDEILQIINKHSHTAPTTNSHNWGSECPEFE